MRIAVVTPYHNEKPEWLRRCYESVRAQTHAVQHVFVADGNPASDIDAWDCDHLIIKGPNDDGGSMARGIGALQYAAYGCDAIAFLDSDNWFQVDHIESLIRLIKRTNAHVGAAFADPYRIDGSKICDGAPQDPKRVIDSSCLFITKEAYPLLPLWMRLAQIGKRSEDPTQRSWSYGGLICDRIFAYALHTFNIPVAVNDHSTVCYTVKSQSYYQDLGETPPAEANKDTNLIEAWNWWQNLAPLDRVNYILGALPLDRRPHIVLQERPPA